MVDRVNVFVVKHPAEVVALLTKPEDFSPVSHTARGAGETISDSLPDFRDVRGQTTAKRGLQVAAAGTLCFPANFMLVAAMNPCPFMRQMRRARSLRASLIDNGRGRR